MNYVVDALHAGNVRDFILFLYGGLIHHPGDPEIVYSVLGRYLSFLLTRMPTR